MFGLAYLAGTPITPILLPWVPRRALAASCADDLLIPGSELYLNNNIYISLWCES